jgi:hypothetical protein
MNLHKTFVVLLALLLAAMTMVPMISAQTEVDENLPLTSNNSPDVDKSQWKGVGGTEVTHTGNISGKSFAASGTYTWTAGTDIWNPVIGVQSSHYSYSRMNNAPFDIDKIGVRGRVWKNNILQFDQPDESQNAADASVSFATPWGTPIVGSWFARSNHVFEEASTNDYIYPITEDFVNC